MRVLGVCAGNGVMVYPFKEYLIGNVEPRSVFHSPLEKQWFANFSCQIAKTLDEVGDWQNNQAPIDFIIGHPDCGHSSVLAYSRAKKLGKPKENPSLLLFIEAVKRFKPKGFLLENLPKLAQTFGKSALKKAFKGYKLKFIKCSVSKFGNSQKGRVRLLIVGFRKKHRSLFKHIELPKGKATFKTSELLGGLKYPDYDAAHVREDDNTIITIYAGKKLSVKKVKRLWNTKFKGMKRWPVKNRNFTTAPGVYRNLANDYPATVRKGNREFNPAGEMMTPRERARIQGVPDNFKIVMEKGKELYWINKGRITVTKTPPYEIGVWFYNCLTNPFLL